MFSRAFLFPEYYLANFKGLMKPKKWHSGNQYCGHVCVIVYAESTGKGKGVMKKVNEVSRLAGVSKRTLQFYDDEGLLPAQRSKDNYRLYDDAALERLWEILVYRAMGLDLKGNQRSSDAFGETKKSVSGKENSRAQATDQTA